MVMDEVAEIGMATESLADYPDLVTLPCYEWQHVLVLPPATRWRKKERIDAGGPGAEPLITYHPSFTGRTRIDPPLRSASSRRASCWKRSTPTSSRPMCAWAWASASWPRWRCATTASNSDLVVRPLGHLFGQNVARVAFKRGAYLRNFVFKFAELLSDRLDRNLIAKAMTGHVNDYEL
jgi:LysR family cys regulon transcriptional activator